MRGKDHPVGPALPALAWSPCEPLFGFEQVLVGWHGQTSLPVATCRNYAGTHVCPCHPSRDHSGWMSVQSKTPERSLRGFVLLPTAHRRAARGSRR